MHEDLATLAGENDAPSHVFAYGTLRRGDDNDIRLLT